MSNFYLAASRTNINQADRCSPYNSISLDLILTSAEKVVDLCGSLLGWLAAAIRGTSCEAFAPDWPQTSKLVTLLLSSSPLVGDSWTQ